MTISPPAGPLGAQVPRIRHRPAAETSAGQDAADVAAAAGLILDPWQRLVIDDALGEREDGKWASFEVAMLLPRQNGKGSVLEARILAGMLLFGERLLIWTAHEFKTAMEAFRRCEALFESSDDLRRRVKRVSRANGEEGIELFSGARLKFLARSKGSGRGFSGDVVILDEAYALTSEHLDALMPTLSARPNPQIWYASSPPLDEDGRRKAGAPDGVGTPLYALRERAEKGDPALTYLDWGLPGTLEDLDEKTPDEVSAILDDPANWAASNPAEGIRITREHIARERRGMTPRGFARERLGIWPAPPVEESSRVLSVDDWAALEDEASLVAGDLAIAVDITPLRDVASIAVYGLRADGLGHVELVDHRPGTAWVVPRLVQLAETHRPVAIGLDTRSPAGSLLTDLDKAGISRPDNPDRPRRGQLATPGGQEYAGACGLLVDAVREGTLRHIGQVQLATAIAGAKTRPVADGFGWARKAATVDISPLVAVTLARWAYTSRAHLIDDTSGQLTGSLMA